MISKVNNLRCKECAVVASGRNGNFMFYGILKVPIYKKLRSKNVGNKVRCAKPTIRKKYTVTIMSKDGKEISLDIFDLKYLNMHNGHKFITGKVHEERGGDSSPLSETL